MNVFTARINALEKSAQCREKLKILQVNVGNLCNQHCKHCHVSAGPDEKNIMSKGTIDSILEFLSYDKGLVLDITGGAPEMNPNFQYFVSSARPLAKEIIVRSNLTVFFEQGKEGLPSFFKDNKVYLICSLPCYTRDNVDKQRGSGAFDKSIKALKMLNDLGYGNDPELQIDLAYNPLGAYLPGPQEPLEKDYKKILKEEHGIVFNKLITMINTPINRFKEQLEAEDELDKYMELLEGNFNENIVKNIMCRTLLSVGRDGILYDCDFNQALGLALKDENGRIMKIGETKPADLENKEIIFENHCFSCTAGSGSSCSGALTERREKGTK